MTEILNGMVGQIHSGCLHLSDLYCNNIAETMTETVSQEHIKAFKSPQLFLMNWYLKPNSKLKIFCYFPIVPEF